MVMTISGNVYSWGDNAHGQLGQGDQVMKLRPELIRSIRATRAVKISCGKNHSAIIAQNGLLFTCGANTHGQCGLDVSIKQQLYPIVVDNLRDRTSLEVCCGATHTLVLAVSNTSESKKQRVYVLGSNSCGQLGVGREFQTITQPMQLSFESGLIPSAIASSPLSMLSFVITGDIKLRKRDLPSVAVGDIQEMIEKIQKLPFGTETSHPAIRATREMISAAFSSLSVLNASFIDVGSLGHGRLCVDLNEIRKAYSLIMSVEKLHPSVIATLGRATLHLSDQLRGCPFDDGENLSVFFIVLENPLMIRAAEFHVAIERVIGSILSLPKTYRLLLFKWMKSYPSEYFGRVLQILQNYISFAVTSRSTNLDPTPAVLVLETLHECNDAENIIPYFTFYNDTILKKIDILQEYEKWKEQGQNSQVFNYCSYSFLLNESIKYKMLQHDNSISKYRQINRHFDRYKLQTVLSQDSIPLHDRLVMISNVLPYGAKAVLDERTNGSVSVNLVFRILVRRDHLLEDLRQCLYATLASNVDTLQLPLQVEFEGEVGLDRGGLAKEMFTIAIRDLIRTTGVLAASGNGRIYWFTRVDSSDESNKQARTDSNSPKSLDTTSPEFILGLLAGLAVYNGIYVDLPIPSSIYKLMKNKELNLADLWQVDNELARGLKQLLDFPEGGHSIEDTFGSTFAVSRNPLIDNVIVEEGRKSVGQYIELIPGGQDIFVNRSNRQRFVDEFVRYALQRCCNGAINQYFQGLQVLFPARFINMSSHEELEHLICGSTEIGDLSELRIHTTYRGRFNDEHQVVNWFWKRKFLSFLTGSERVPIGGIANLGLVIQSTEQDEQALPTSHTCFNILDLPSTYSSPDILQDKLLKALEHHEGFGLV